MKYHPNMSPRSLTTVEDHLRHYPKYWELMKWYTCWRKYPYPTEAIACLVAEGRSEAYSHYPCPLEPEHWHIGRGGGQADPRGRIQRAKRAYRKAVRDEIWRDHERKNRVVRNEESSGRAPALAD